MPKPLSKQRRAVILLLIGLCLIIYSMVRLWDWYASTHGTAPAPNASQVSTGSSGAVDEKPVPTDATYTVPADQPKKITIPSIGAEGFIQKVGQTTFKEIGAPSNVHYAGWFTGSLRPGEAGLSIIDGHVSGRYTPGLFAKLQTLQKGALLSVQFGDDSLRKFVVVDKRELPRDEASKYLLVKRTDISQQLNLITCGGEFDKKSEQYKSRIIVVTKRID